MNQSEKQLQKAILDYIKSVPGCKAVKVMAANERGTPDIIACVKGFFLAVEVKAPKGKMSKIQEAQQSEWLAADGAYIVAKSLDRVKVAVKILLSITKAYRDAK